MFLASSHNVGGEEGDSDGGDEIEGEVGRLSQEKGARTGASTSGLSLTPMVVVSEGGTGHTR